MRTVITTCDTCHRQIEAPNKVRPPHEPAPMDTFSRPKAYREVYDKRLPGYRITREYDLCDRCWGKFAKFTEFFENEIL